MEDLISQDIKEKYKDEWLLFEVLETDEKGKPKESKLIWHSKEKKEVYKVVVGLKVKRGYLFFYNGEVVPKGYNVVL